MVRHLKLAKDNRARSSISNGSRVMPLGMVDGRSAAYRRYKDLMHGYYTDLGGEASLSQGQLALVRRAVCLQVELEAIEARFIEGGGASASQLDSYTRASNTLKRLCESLGVHRGRVAKDVTPPDLSSYLADKTNGARRNGRTNRVRVVEHEVDEDDA